MERNEFASGWLEGRRDFDLSTSPFKSIDWTKLVHLVCKHG